MCSAIWLYTLNSAALSLGSAFSAGWLLPGSDGTASAMVERDRGKLRYLSAEVADALRVRALTKLRCID